MTHLNTFLPWFALLVLTTSSCTVEHSYTDNGVLCAHGDYLEGISVLPETTEFISASKISFQYSSPGCLSASCDTQRSAECSVETEGNLLRVTSTASYTASFSVGCTDDCGTIITQCQSKELPAGEYRIVHGTEEMTLTVPSTVAPPCVRSQ